MPVPAYLAPATAVTDPESMLNINISCEEDFGCACGYGLLILLRTYYSVLLYAGVLHGSSRALTMYLRNVQIWLSAVRTSSIGKGENCFFQLHVEQTFPDVVKAVSITTTKAPNRLPNAFVCLFSSLYLSSFPSFPCTACLILLFQESPKSTVNTLSPGRSITQACQCITRNRTTQAAPCDSIANNNNKNHSFYQEAVRAQTDQGWVNTGER